jgi:hypothetical protein
LDSSREMLSKSVRKLLGNAQRLLDSLWAILKEYRKAAGKCPNTCCQPESRQNYPAAVGKNVAISIHFPELPHFYIYWKKIKDTLKNKKKSQRFFS